MIRIKGTGAGRRILSAVLSIFILFVSFTFVGCDFQLPTPIQLEQGDDNIHLPIIYAGDEMVIHFIDVGQGDCSLVQGGGVNILIDSGENGMGTVVVEYLEKIGVSKLHWIIGSHPHSDHIGGIDTVIKSVEVDNLMLPVVDESLTPVTSTYSDVLDAAEEYDVSLTMAKAGDFYEFDGMMMEILSPDTQFNYSDLNDCSLVVRFSVNGFSYLTTGDISSSVERDILENGYDVSADVLKLAHHGSSTSSSWAFLKRSAPQYAVVSCGFDNDYGHPHDIVIDRLNELDITIVRRDRLGNVVFTYKEGAVDVAAVD
ncbi:MAG: MBL fold metallo-hydrolase [Ruminococcaceae bacterium]|nr:MBL fold metallo-hydrolase [Oscillospiraceae bacterium]